MFITGITDEAGGDLKTQIDVAKILGWRYIDLRNANGANVCLLGQSQFDELVEQITANGLKVASLSSTIGNWSKSIFKSPEDSYQELKQAIPRLHRLGTPFIRVMSFQCPWNSEPYINDPVEKEVIKRMLHLVAMAEDGGVTLLHENCDNWGGHSFEHTLRLLDAVPSPNLKIVFDTANPIATQDTRGTLPYGFQNPWEFYQQVKHKLAYIHIKDANIVEGKKVHVFPGEGIVEVERILRDLKRSGYEGGICIEPHVAVQYHDASIQSEPEARKQTFIDYGFAMEVLLKNMGWYPNPRQ